LCSTTARTTPAVPSGRRVSWSPFIESVEGIHFLLDDVGDGADGAREQAGFLDDRGDDLLVAVALQDRFGGVFEQLPQRRVGREDVVHAFDGDDFLFFVGHSISSLRRPREGGTQFARLKRVGFPPSRERR
jgi:hypothetical protein